MAEAVGEAAQATETPGVTPEEIRLVQRLEHNFLSVIRHRVEQDWRAAAERCFNYRDNEQWTAEELKELNRRHQQPSINNQVKVTIDRLVGQFLKLQTRIGFRARTPKSSGGAAAMSDVLRYIRQSNNLAFEERNCFEDGATGGRGVLYWSASFNDALQPEIKIRRVNPFEVFPDGYSKRDDWNEDAEHVSWAKWAPPADLEALNPAMAGRIRQLMDGSFVSSLSEVDRLTTKHFLDYDDQGRVFRIRAIEQWYRNKVREQIVLSTGDDGHPVTLRKSDLSREALALYERRGLREIDRLKVELRVALFTQGILISDKPDPHLTGLYPFVPYFVHRRADGMPYGPVYAALPLQDSINKRESKSIHLLNSAKVLSSQNQILDKDEFAEEMAKPDGLPEVKDITKVEVLENRELAVTQYNMHTEGKQDFRHVTGVNPDALGEPSEVRSGVGIQRKQIMTDLILGRSIDNFRLARILGARLTHRMVVTYYTEPTVLLITDDLGAAKELELGAENLEAIKQGIYDIVCEEMPDTTTLQQEQAQMIGTLLPQVLPYGPGWVQVLFEMSDIRNKPEIMALVQKLSTQPPPQPKVTLALQWETLTSHEKVAFAKVLGLPDLVAAEIAEPSDAVATTRAHTELSKAQIAAASKGHSDQVKHHTSELSAHLRLVADHAQGTRDAALQASQQQHERTLAAEQAQADAAAADSGGTNG